MRCSICTFCDFDHRVAIVRELGQPATGFPNATTDELAQFFHGTSAGKLLRAEWTHDASHRLGVVLGRWERMVGAMSDAEFAEIDDFWRLRLTGPERAAVLRALAA